MTSTWRPSAIDLETRWVPSETQIAMAEAVFDARPDADLVLSSHLLLGKEYGFWTNDIEVEYVKIAKVAMNRAMKAGEEARPDDYHVVRNEIVTATARQAGERPCTIGYTVHYRDGTWAVFEEILDVPTILKFARDEENL